MRRNHPEDYGHKFDFDPQWRGPLTLERKHTDISFLVFFILYVVVWIFLGVYAISTGEMKLDFLDPTHENELDHRRSSSKPKDGEIHFAFSWRVMLVAVTFTKVAMLMTYLSLMLMRYFPKTIYYVSAIFTLFVMALLSVFMAVSLPDLVDRFGRSRQTVDALICLVIFMFAITLYFFYYLIRYRKKIRIACGIIQESIEATMFFPSALFIPILEITLYVIPTVFAGLTYLHLLRHPMLEHGARKPIQYYLLHGMNLFGWLWTTQFIYAFAKMILSGTYATWYWSLNKDEIPPGVICRFMQITMRFHLGTIAFGSLIIAIFKFIKEIVDQKKRKLRQQRDYRCMLVVACISCLLTCMQGFVNFINSNAYIMCTIHGTAFFQSGKDAYNLLMRNSMNVIVIIDATARITCKMIMLVFCVSLGGTYLFCKHMTQPEIMAAMLLVGIMTLVVSGLVFKVLGVAIDTVFLSAMEDFERNDGSTARPYFMATALRDLLILDF